MYLSLGDAQDLRRVFRDAVVQRARRSSSPPRSSTIMRSMLLLRRELLLQLEILDVASGSARVREASDEMAIAGAAGSRSRL